MENNEKKDDVKKTPMCNNFKFIMISEDLHCRISHYSVGKQYTSLVTFGNIS
jgi:hypothetical protein